MAPNIDAMIQEGIKAFKAGNKAEARTLLEKAVELDAYNEQGWLWLSAVVDTPEEQRTCLENVLFINPDNVNARKGVEMLNRQLGGASQPSAAPTAAPAPEIEDDPLAEVDFVDPAPGPTSRSSSAPPIATSSASAIYDPNNELTSDDYDNWAATLKLGSSTASQTPEPPASSAFTDFEDIFTSNYPEEDDLRSSDVSSYNRPDDGFDDLSHAAFEGFGADDLLVEDDAPFQADFGDSPFEMKEIDLPETETHRPPSRPSSSIMSPAEERSPAKERDSALKGGALIMDEDYDDDYDDWEHDPEEFFRYIPKEISPTRLPGTKERLSPVMLASLVGLVGLNIGAVFLLVMNLSS